MSADALALAYRIDGRQVPPEAFYARACDPARSVAIEACAGAGKTWMLVSRILRALLAGAAPQDILAITFTNKAAGEMRERLQQELARWAVLGDEELLDALCQRGLAAADARALLPAARGLQARLRAQGRPVQLMTFHGWFAALLRAAPLSLLQSLGLPPSYELQQDDAPLIERTWPRFFAAVADDAALEADFFASVADIGRHNTLEALRKAAGKRVEFTLADEAGVVDACVEPLAARFPELADVDDPLGWLVQAEAPRRVLFAAASALGAASQKKAQKAAGELEQALHADSLNAGNAVAALRTQKGEPRKLGDAVDSLAAVQDAHTLIERVQQAQRQQNARAHHQRMARLTRVFLACLAELKRERGWVDMNDVEGAARRLLGDAELSGWLQQRLDARVRHLLIDEFQDTNPLQWQALYGWLSAYAGAGSGEAPSVFLVGDPKQSIYRFRRAEPQVFRAAQAFVVQGLGGALLACDHTRRCAVAVVDAVNAVMDRAVADGDYGEAVGAAFRGHTTASGEAGAVLALPEMPRSARVRNDAGTTGWRDSLTQPRHLPEDVMSQLEARQAADWVAAEIAAGRVAPQDVMVLARKRERLGWMHEALRERGIASDEPEKTELADAPAVQDVIALIDALVSPGHDLSLARALRSPIGGWDDGDLARLAQRVQTARAAEEGTTWWAVLQGAAQDAQAPALWRDTAARWAGWQSALLALPPHDALSRILREGDLLARYAEAAPPAQRAAVLSQLQALLSLSLQHEGGRYLTAYRLVRAVRAGGLTLAPVAAPGAVRLLTIHGAKGLEAHTVLLLDTHAAPSRPENTGVLVDWPGEAAHPQRFVFLTSEKAAPLCAQDLLEAERRARSLEELNALYVAMTRAATRLVISRFEPHQASAQPTWWDRLAPVAQAIDAPVPVGAAAAGGVEAWPLQTLPSLRVSPEPVQRDAAADEEATRWGQAVHRLLQWCPTPAAGFDWGEPHQRAIERAHGLDTARSAEALAAARRIVRGEAAWAWDPARLDHWGNEVDLVHQGQALRLDRLVRERAGGAWWVIDFKSHESPHTVPEHREQLRGYRAALQASQPGDTVRLAFITAQGRFIELDPDAP